MVGLPLERGVRIRSALEACEVLVWVEVTPGFHLSCRPTKTYRLVASVPFARQRVP